MSNHNLPTIGIASKPDGHQNPAVSASSPSDGDLMNPVQNVQRIMRTGTIWFATAVAATSVFLGLVLLSGWRPGNLTAGTEAMWWTGAASVAIGVALLGWSGCPILEVDVPTANRNKTKTMQVGTGLFIVGATCASLAVLLGSAVQQ